MVNEDHPRCNVPRKTIKACPDGGSGALSLTWRAATQPHLLHRISVVRVYLHIAATTADPAGWDLCHPSPNSYVEALNPNTTVFGDRIYQEVVKVK